MTELKPQPVLPEYMKNMRLIVGQLPDGRIGCFYRRDTTWYEMTWWYEMKETPSDGR